MTGEAINITVELRDWPKEPEKEVLNFNNNILISMPYSRRERRGSSGRGRREKEEFESQLLDLARVAHTREGGKKLKFRAVMVVGDQKGRVGVGVASGLDVAKAIEKATRLAKKNIIMVPIKESTIPHEVRAKYGAAKVMLKPQRLGRGLVAGGTVRIICHLSGIKNISSKILGATGNKINNARATIRALKKLTVQKKGQ